MARITILPGIVQQFDTGVSRGESLPAVADSTVGDLFVLTTATTAELHIFTGGAWVELSGGGSTSSALPLVTHSRRVASNADFGIPGDVTSQISVGSTVTIQGRTYTVQAVTYYGASTGWPDYNYTNVRIQGTLGQTINAGVVVTVN